jgi:hypothetical protein
MRMKLQSETPERIENSKVRDKACGWQDLRYRNGK